MSIHLQRDIERLKKDILALSLAAEDDLRSAVKAAAACDTAACEAVLSRESRIDSMEVDIEEECLKLLALHQPVAGDLRYIVAVLQINRDLERIGDIAANIAKRGIALSRESRTNIPFRWAEMADRAIAMLQKVHGAFIDLDVSAAREVCAMDAAVDELKRETILQAKNVIRLHPEHLEALLQIMHLARHLERVADHATNIAEDVIYLVEGRIVRHKMPEFGRV